MPSFGRRAVDGQDTSSWRPSGRLGFADFEPGDVLGGGAGDLGGELIAVVDAEGGPGGFDGQGRSRVAGADADALTALSLSPDGGIRENIGKPYDFELPYWAGEHPVKPVPGWPNQRPYPMPFHPLALGAQALRALFGFIVEGHPELDDIDTEAVHLHGFRVTDPSGEEEAAREAAYGKALRAMGPPRRFRMGPDGTVHEVSLESH